MCVEKDLFRGNIYVGVLKVLKLSLFFFSWSAGLLSFSGSDSAGDVVLAGIPGGL